MIGHRSESTDFSPAERERIEVRTYAWGRECFHLLPDRRPQLWQRRWWDEQLLQWAMRDESLKVELFRFVDVLPTLRSSEDLAATLYEYLAPVADHLPLPIRLALGLSSHTTVTRGAVARAVRLATHDLARRFIAAQDAREVLAVAERLRKQKQAFTLDILGEAVTSEKEADGYFRAYAELFESLTPRAREWPEVPLIDQDRRGPLPRVNVSIKLSALDSQFDPIAPETALRRCGPRFRELLRIARRNGAFLNVDMESYAKKDLTLYIVQSVLSEAEFRDFADVGIVIQCYLPEALDDLAALVEWVRQRGAPLWVRLVKGAYWDYETLHAQANNWPIPVFQEKWQSDAQFEAATRFVLRHAAELRLAVGTHNLRSIAHALAVAEHLKLPPQAVEYQMLYGMADAEKEVLVNLGRRVRVYMPFGELIPGMAYLVRRLLENTSNDSFLRAGFVERRPPKELLANPERPRRVAGLEEPVRAEESEPLSPAPVRGEPSMKKASPVDSFPVSFRNEPPVDFARPEAREAMQRALADVRSQLGQDYPLWIGDQALTTERIVESRDPSFDAQVVGRVAQANLGHVEPAVEAARAALPGWRDGGVARRAEFLRRAAERMRQRQFELAAWTVYECGKPWREATGDIHEAIDFCEYYAAGALALQGAQGADVPGEENRFEYWPRGVVAVIAPWNFPFAILTGMSVAALATGNTVVMKPAQQSSVVAAKLAEVFREIGLPPGVLNYLPGRGSEVGGTLVEHRHVAMIAFTGSRQTGLEIYKKAAEASAHGLKFVKQVIAEMGGKNAIIVDTTADLDEAVQGVVTSAFGYQGQKCSACSRAIVLDEVYDVFLERLVEAARSLQVGPAADPATAMGPVIDGSARAKIRQYIQLGRQQAREVLSVELPDLEEQGHFVGPHIYADVLPASSLAQEEIFGPVLSVLRARDLSEAFRIANDVDYALTGGFYSRTPSHLERARRELEVGNLYLNRAITGAMVGRQPFGGFKLSGAGSKAGGPDYLLHFVLPRTVTENTMRRGFAPKGEGELSGE